MTTSTITFTNHYQYICWEFEMRGQISDGMWENSRPYDHYKFWCNLTALYNEDLDVGCVKGPYCSMANFKNNYNFLNKELLDIVGGRMIDKCILADVLISLDYDIINMDKNMIYNLMSSIDRISDIKSYDEFVIWRDKKINQDSYYEKYLVFSSDMINRFIALRDSEHYTMKNLRSDLKEMKKTIKNVVFHYNQSN